MPENSKQELLLSDLNIIQSEVEILANKCKDLTGINEKLESEISVLKNEKSDLLQKISNLESELQNKKVKTGSTFFSSVGDGEREELKNTIGDLISRIDFHLSADQSRRKLDEVDRQI